MKVGLWPISGIQPPYHINRWRRYYDVFQVPNHQVTSIGEDDTRYPPVLFGICILLKTLHGLYDFSFVRGPMWTNLLDLLRGVLTRFGSRILHGFSCFDLRCVLLDTLHGLHEFESYIKFSWVCICFDIY